MTASVRDRAPAAPHFAALRQLFAERFALFRGAFDKAEQEFGGAWIDEFDNTLGALFPSEQALALAAKGYASFAIDILRRQAAFERDPRYPHTSYADAVDTVYSDDGYMSSEYLPGLLLSHYLWPHHYRQARFFDIAFLEPMRHRRADRMLEIGVGTGIYSRMALQAVPGLVGTGVDISPASLEFTRRHVAAFGLADRYEATLHDVLAAPVEPLDWLVCVEVLEHLEDPTALLRALRAALRPGGRGFITAAIDAPHVDHIYLYRDPSEVVTQLVAAGFALEQEFVAPAHPPREPGLPVPTVAAFVVS